jgi:hypothetical protein
MRGKAALFTTHRYVTTTTGREMSIWKRLYTSIPHGPVAGATYAPLRAFVGSKKIHTNTVTTITDIRVGTGIRDPVELGASMTRLDSYLVPCTSLVFPNTCS